MTQTIAAPQFTAQLTPDPTAGFRRFCTAVALPLGILAQAVVNLAYALATLNGGDDSTAANAMELYSSEEGLLRLATVALIVGVMILIVGLPTATRVLRPTRPRLALIAVALMGAGYISYAVVSGTNWLVMALGEHHVDAAAAIDASQNDPSAQPWFLVFVAGNLVGTLLLGLAALLSRGVPKLAGVLIIAWPVLHVTGLIAGSEWFEVAGAILETVGLAMVAAIALRLPLDEWRTRG
ncbi:hypothetical protein [Gryllotalpicola protaetiae]|uniref:DUF4386 family protein n=1 Tax=Gryllotalpicola protaetiae TaxID=2419771 RepID=A0A387C1S4_9MICO|nr:hypothetical protein [Gryllotalpicola protaetiae]AYG04461.1 hypothetical protein D7I44_13590 [Gryllotalpicola protaetiae]